VSEQCLENASFPIVVGPGQRFVAFRYFGSGSNQRLNRFCAVLAKIEFIGDLEILQVLSKWMRVVCNLDGKLSESIVSAILISLPIVIPDPPDNLAIFGPVGFACLGK